MIERLLATLEARGLSVKAGDAPGVLLLAGPADEKTPELVEAVKAFKPLLLARLNVPPAPPQPPPVVPVYLREPRPPRPPHTRAGLLAAHAAGRWVSVLLPGGAVCRLGEDGWEAGAFACVAGGPWVRIEPEVGGG